MRFARLDIVVVASVVLFVFAYVCCVRVLHARGSCLASRCLCPELHLMIYFVLRVHCCFPCQRRSFGIVSSLLSACLHQFRIRFVSITPLQRFS